LQVLVAARPWRFKSSPGHHLHIQILRSKILTVTRHARGELGCADGREPTLLQVFVDLTSTRIQDAIYAKVELRLVDLEYFAEFGDKLGEFAHGCASVPYWVKVLSSWRSRLISFGCMNSFSLPTWRSINTPISVSRLRYSEAVWRFAM